MENYYNEKRNVLYKIVNIVSSQVCKKIEMKIKVMTKHCCVLSTHLIPKNLMLVQILFQFY